MTTTTEQSSAGNWPRNVTALAAAYHQIVATAAALATDAERDTWTKLVGKILAAMATVPAQDYRELSIKLVTVQAKIARGLPTAGEALLTSAIRDVHHMERCALTVAI